MYSYYLKVKRTCKKTTHCPHCHRLAWRWDYQDVREELKKQWNKNTSSCPDRCANISMWVSPWLAIIYSYWYCYTVLILSNRMSTSTCYLYEFYYTSWKKCTSCIHYYFFLLLAALRPGYEVRSPRKQTTLTTLVLRPMPTARRK